MLPHRIEENLSFCPRDVTTYAALHLDTISKVLNHVLWLLLAFNILLFFACWSQSFVPQNTLPTVWISLFLLLQNATVWAIINNARVPANLSFLAPNDFIMGVALGITIGASILSFILSQSFKYGTCPTASTISTHTDDDRLSNHTTTNRETHCNRSTGIWFWGGLVFWLNFSCSLLLAVGRREYSHLSNQYEPVGTSSSNGGTTTTGSEPRYVPSSGGYHNSGPTFAGDYANIPEIRPDHDNMNHSNHGSVSSKSESAKIMSV
jgi:hypothetical protein